MNELKTKIGFSLENKIALITGGSRGIGRATALGFAKAGADVVVASRKLSDLEKVVVDVKKCGRESLAISVNITKIENLGEVVKKVTKRFGRIDILINNAGGSPAISSALDTDELLWDKVMNLNLKGLFFLSQAVARIMKDKGGGKIINITSIDGLRPDRNIGVYAISKAGVIMATKVMAKEWARYNIRVNAIAPGHVHTHLGDSYLSAIPAVKEEILKRTPVGRIAEPDEIVWAMIYMASDASSFVTGETLLVDGGILLT